MKDHVKISGITGKGNHGVFAFEREAGQRFSVDVTLFFSFDKASTSDELSHTVDYGQVAEVTHKILHGDPVQLIEALAVKIAQEVLALGGIDEIEVTVHKPEAPIPVPFDDVTATVRRSALSGS